MVFEALSIAAGSAGAGALSRLLLPESQTTKDRTPRCRWSKWSYTGSGTVHLAYSAGAGAAIRALYKYFCHKRDDFAQAGVTLGLVLEAPLWIS